MQYVTMQVLIGFMLTLQEEGVVEEVDIEVVETKAIGMRYCLVLELSHIKYQLRYCITDMDVIGDAPPPHFR